MTMTDEELQNFLTQILTFMQSINKALETLIMMHIEKNGEAEA